MDSVVRFLETCGWAGARRMPIAGDASARRYERLETATGATAVLMIDQDVEIGSISRFLAVSDTLLGGGLSAPRTLAADIGKGVVLLEDFGPLRIADGLSLGTFGEKNVYPAVIETLVALQSIRPEIALATPDRAVMAAMTDLALSWYAKGVHDEPAPGASPIFPALETILAEIEPATPVPVHRDFHAENLFWLPDREGAARIGIIDFQDMFLGHPVYDLVSLLTDARRDISLELRTEMIGYFCDLTQQLRPEIEKAFAVISVQRNMRILGVFARLAIRDHKTQYLDLIPRVWSYLTEALAHPDLKELSEHLVRALPAPDAGHMSFLRASC